MLYFLTHHLLGSVQSSWMNRVHGLFTGSRFGISSLNRFSGSLTFLASLQAGWRVLSGLPALRLDPLDGEHDVLLFLPPGPPDLRDQGIGGEYFGDLPPGLHKCKFMVNILLILGGEEVFRFEDGHQDVFTGCLTADAGDPFLV